MILHSDDRYCSAKETWRMEYRERSGYGEKHGVPASRNTRERRNPGQEKCLQDAIRMERIRQLTEIEA